MSRTRRNFASLMRLALFGALALELVALHFPTPSGVSESPGAESSVRTAWTLAGRVGRAGGRFVPDALDPLLDDKAVHFGLFFALALLWAGACGLERRLDARSSMTIFALLCVYAGLGEASQVLFGRIPDVFDWVANVLGSAAGVASVALTSLVSWTLVQVAGGGTSSATEMLRSSRSPATAEGASSARRSQKHGRS